MIMRMLGAIQNMDSSITVLKSQSRGTLGTQSLNLGNQFTRRINMSRVYDNYVSRYLTDEDELIYPSDEALDEYAEQWEEIQRKELVHGKQTI